MTGTSTRRQFIASLGAVVGGALVILPAHHAEAVASASRHVVLTAATTTSLPDLVVTDLIIPDGIIVGQAVRFGAVVKNQGTASTPTGVTIGVGFHVDGTEVTWAGADRTSLAPGSSITLYATSNNIGVDTWKATSGEHTLEAIVNDAHRFPETSFSNNSLSSSFSVTAAVSKPVNTSLPVITGVAKVGNVLKASTGTWS